MTFRFSVIVPKSLVGSEASDWRTLTEGGIRREGCRSSAHQVAPGRPVWAELSVRLQRDKRPSFILSTQPAAAAPASSSRAFASSQQSIFASVRRRQHPSYSDVYPKKIQVLFACCCLRSVCVTLFWRSVISWCLQWTLQLHLSSPTSTSSSHLSEKRTSSVQLTWYRINNT